MPQARYRVGRIWERLDSPVPFHYEASGKPRRFRHRLRRYYSDCFADRWGRQRSLNSFCKSQFFGVPFRVPNGQAWYMAFSKVRFGSITGTGFVEAAFNRGFGHQCRTFGDFGDPIKMPHVVDPGARSKQTTSACAWTTFARSRRYL